MGNVAYVDDVERSNAFFERMLDLTPMLRGDGLTAFDAGSLGVLLVCRRGASFADMPSLIRFVPGHDGSGRLHMAFAVRADAYDAWCRHLAEHDVIYSEVRWPRGGRGVYFHDPDGHRLELATPGLWSNY